MTPDEFLDNLFKESEIAKQYLLASMDFARRADAKFSYIRACIKNYKDERELPLAGEHEVRRSEESSQQAV